MHQHRIKEDARLLVCSKGCNVLVPTQSTTCLPPAFATSQNSPLPACLLCVYVHVSVFMAGCSCSCMDTDINTGTRDIADAKPGDVLVCQALFMSCLLDAASHDKGTFQVLQAAG